MSAVISKAVPSWHCEEHETFDAGCRECRQSRPDRRAKAGAMLPHQMDAATASISDTAIQVWERYEAAYRVAHENPRYGQGGGSGISDPTGASVVGARGNRELVEDVSNAIEAAATAMKLAMYALVKLELQVDESHPLTPGIHERQRERPAGRAQLSESMRVKARSLVTRADKLDRQIAAEEKAVAKRVAEEKAKAKRRPTTSAYEVAS